MKRFLILFVFLSALAIGVGGFVLAAHAQNIGSFPGQPAPSSGDLPGFIKAFYDFGLLIGGLLAIGMIAAGAVYYSISGAVDKQSEAKSMITSALLGLALLFGSYLILSNINPRLTTLTVDAGCPAGEAKDENNNCVKITCPVVPSTVISGATTTQHLEKGVCVPDDLNTDRPKDCEVKLKDPLCNGKQPTVGGVTNFTYPYYTPGDLTHATCYVYAIRTDTAGVVKVEMQTSKIPDNMRPC